MWKVLIALISVVIVIALGWAVTCGIIKLITLCFGWKFNLLIATGIWLALCLLKDVFRNNRGN